MVLQELAAYLETAGLGTRGTDLFYGIMPESPDAAIALFVYAGLPNEVEMGGTTVRLEFPFVQVTVRGAKDDYDGPEWKAQRVVNAFTAIGTQIISGTAYKAVMAIQPPFFFRRDDNFRCEFKVNFRVTKGPSAS